VGWRSFASLLQTCLSIRHVLSDASCCQKCSHRHVLCVARPSPRNPADMKVSLLLQLLSATVALCAAEDNRLGWDNRLWVCVICDGSDRVESWLWYWYAWLVYIWQDWGISRHTSQTDEWVCVVVRPVECLSVSKQPKSCSEPFVLSWWNLTDDSWTLITAKKLTCTQSAVVGKMFALLRCFATYIGSYLPAFRENLPVPSAGVRQF